MLNKSVGATVLLFSVLKERSSLLQGGFGPAEAFAADGNNLDMSLGW